MTDKQNNDAQIEYWNGQAGETWASAQERMDVMLEPLSDQAVDKAAPQASERVLDIGCGCGATSLALAQRGALVTGIDISAPMLARARERSAQMSDLEFLEADAAVHPHSSDHQLVFSRFGVMFFADPIAAFANLRTALDEQGRLVFLCWQSPAENPWVSVAGRALQPHLPVQETPDPRAPGPFAFADPDYLNDVLVQAGYHNIVLDNTRATLHLGDSLDSAMEFQGQIGPTARVLSEMEGEARESAIRAAREALSAHVTEAGLDLGAATWLVSATR